MTDEQETRPEGEGERPELSDLVDDAADARGELAQKRANLEAAWQRLNEARA
jgi:hypothetical protein